MSRKGCQAVRINYRICIWVSTTGDMSHRIAAKGIHHVSYISSPPLSLRASPRSFGPAKLSGQCRGIYRFPTFRRLTVTGCCPVLLVGVALRHCHITRLWCAGGSGAGVVCPWLLVVSEVPCRAEGTCSSCALLGCVEAREVVRVYRGDHLRVRLPLCASLLVVRSCPCMARCRMSTHGRHVKPVHCTPGRGILNWLTQQQSCKQTCEHLARGHIRLGSRARSLNNR